MNELEYIEIKGITKRETGNIYSLEIAVEYEYTSYYYKIYKNGVAIESNYVMERATKFAIKRFNKTQKEDK